MLDYSKEYNIVHQNRAQYPAGYQILLSYLHQPVSTRSDRTGISRTPVTFSVLASMLLLKHLAFSSTIRTHSRSTLISIPTTSRIAAKYRRLAAIYQTYLYSYKATVLAPFTKQKFPRKSTLSNSSRHWAKKQMCKALLSWTATFWYFTKLQISNEKPERFQ